MFCSVSSRSGCAARIANWHRSALAIRPKGDQHLVIGHEALGQVQATGSEVQGIEPGDFVVPMVRRPCSPACRSCANRRRDLCITGGFTERGIFGAHGYFTELAVDNAVDLAVVPRE